MKLSGFFADLWNNQRLLMAAGLAGIILFAALLLVAPFDSQQILGINRWIKPMKFSVSGTIFLWTVAVYLSYLPPARRSSARVIARATALTLIVEIFLVTMQAARGTTSHFNHRTPFDAAVFSLMGLLILINTLAVIHLAYLYFRAEISLPRALLWGMRLGLVGFLVGSIQGGYMSAQTGHAVGLADGGAGLPFLSWSTLGGDLRVAHFVGLHAFQIIPLFALLLVSLQNRFAAVRATALTVIFSLLYGATFSLVFAQALKGKPLLGTEIIVTRQTATGGGGENK